MTTTKLVACGTVAGPLFIVAGLAQAATRAGFDLTRHPLSLLSLGELGWIQIANFVVSGALFVACAVGLRRALAGGRAGTWGPRLVGAVGVGLIVAGVFVTDAGAGYPDGAPDGAPEISWHGILHEVGFVVVLLSWTAVCVVFLRRFAQLGLRRWVVACIAVPVAVVAITGWPDLDTFTVRLVIASAVQFGFLGAVALHVIAGRPDLAAGRATVGVVGVEQRVQRRGRVQEEPARG